MVPNGWTLIKLKDIGKCITGLTYSPKNVVNDGLLVLRSSNIQDSKLSFNDNVYVDIEVDKKSKTQFGDILLCVRNGSKNLIGKSAFIYKENEQIDHGAFMSLFRSNETPDYTFQLFQSSQFFRQVNQNLGATINSINSGNLYQFKFPYPPFKEREKIAKILSTWDRSISTTERLIDNSKQQKKALMQQLLTGKKRLLDDSGKPFEGEWLFSTFSEVFKVANNKKTQIKSGDYLESGNIPIVDQGKQLISGYTNNVEKYDDIPVIIFGDHTRIVKWVDFEFAQGADGTQVLKATKRFDTKFTYYLLSNTDIPNLGYSRHMRELKEKDFKHPNSIKEQQKIALVLTNADNEIGLLEQQLADLKQEKKALMQQLLTGKRRVKI